MEFHDQTSHTIYTEDYCITYSSSPPAVLCVEHLHEAAQNSRESLAYSPELVTASGEEQEIISRVMRTVHDVLTSFSSEDATPASLSLAEFDYLRGCRHLMEAIDQADAAQQSLDASSVIAGKVTELRNTLDQLEGLSAIVDETSRAIQSKLDRFALKVTSTYDQIKRETQEQEPHQEDIKGRVSEPTYANAPPPCLAGPTLEVMPEPLVIEGPLADPYSRGVVLSPSQMRYQTPCPCGPLSEVMPEPLANVGPTADPHSRGGAISPSQLRYQTPCPCGPLSEVMPEPLVNVGPTADPYSRGGAISPSQMRYQSPCPCGPLSAEVLPEPLVNECPLTYPYSRGPSQLRYQTPCPCGRPLSEVLPEPLVNECPLADPYSRGVAISPSQMRYQTPCPCGPLSAEVLPEPLVNECPLTYPYSRGPSQLRYQTPCPVLSEVMPEFFAVVIIPESEPAYSVDGGLLRSAATNQVDPTLDVLNPLVEENPSADPCYGESTMSPLQQRHTSPCPSGSSPVVVPAPITVQDTSTDSHGSMDEFDWFAEGFDVARLDQAPPVAVEPIAEIGRDADDDTDTLDSSYHSPPRPASESSFTTSSSSEDISIADSGYCSAGSQLSESSSGSSGLYILYDPNGNADGSSSETSSCAPVPLRHEEEEGSEDAPSVASAEPQHMDPPLRRAAQKRRRESSDCDINDAGSSASYDSATDRGQPSAKRIRQ